VGDSRPKAGFLLLSCATWRIRENAGHERRLLRRVVARDSRAERRGFNVRGATRPWAEAARAVHPRHARVLRFAAGTAPEQLGSSAPCAGSTTVARHLLDDTMVQPRTRGSDFLPTDRVDDPRGSSARGAGPTTAVSHWTRCVTVHPRTRGSDTNPSSSNSHGGGSSAHVRVQTFVGQRPQQPDWFIRARAGRTPAASATTPHPAVHPRSRGSDGMGDDHQLDLDGSSARGSDSPPPSPRPSATRGSSARARVRLRRRPTARRGHRSIRAMRGFDAIHRRTWLIRVGSSARARGSTLGNPGGSCPQTVQPRHARVRPEAARSCGVRRGSSAPRAGSTRIPHLHRTHQPVHPRHARVQRPVPRD